MKKFIRFIPVLAALSITSAYAADSISTDFTDSQGKQIGTATLKEMENGTLITVDVQLLEGAHAMHIHENAKCDAPDFKMAGGHFGMEGDKKHFTGDLPNLYVESTGHIKEEIFAPQLRLDGKNGLMKGASIIIHQNGDDFGISAASAGGRIACAVIKP
jgi:Cu-Zn family superoxide dismutase